MRITGRVVQEYRNAREEIIQAVDNHTIFCEALNDKQTKFKVFIEKAMPDEDVVAEIPIIEAGEYWSAKDRCYVLKNKGLPEPMAIGDKVILIRRSVLQHFSCLRWQGESTDEFFFTFGSSLSMPFQGGWIQIEATSRRHAQERFKELFGEVNGMLSYCSLYSRAEWESREETEDMREKGNLGAFCHQRYVL